MFFSPETLRNGLLQCAEAKVVQYGTVPRDKGTMIWFLFGQTGGDLVVKSSPKNVSLAEFSRKLSAVSVDAGSEEYRSQMILPEVLEVDGCWFEVQPMVHARNLLKSMRRVIPLNPERGFRIGVDLCERLGDVRLDADVFAGSGWQAVREAAADCDLPVGLVHNDFAATNVLYDSQKSYLIDWVDMDAAPPAFNLYEFCINYCSLLSAGRFKKRGIRHFTSAFAIIGQPQNQAIASLFRSAHASLAPDPAFCSAPSLFRKFLNYKASLDAETSPKRRAKWAAIAGASDQMANELQALLSSA